MYEVVSPDPGAEEVGFRDPVEVGLPLPVSVAVTGQMVV